MYTHLNKTAVFQNQYGENEELRRTRWGWRMKRQTTTPAIEMNRVIAKLMGQKIREMREDRGLTMKQLGISAGMTGNPKQRVWAIENATRGEGIRLGTLFAIAMVLDCEVSDLLPSVEETSSNSEFGLVQIKIVG